MNTTNVVICGAGIAGVATAYHLAIQEGITNVVLVDKHAPLSQTTSKSGENYRNWWPNANMVGLMNRSIDIMDALAEQTGNVFQIKRRGYVYATTADDPQPLVDGLVARYSDLEVGPIRMVENAPTAYLDSLLLADAERIDLDGADVLQDADLIQQAFPHFASDVSAIVHVRRAGDISAQQLGMYLLEEARKRGVRLLQGEVTSITQDGQGVSGVVVATKSGNEQLSTRCVVNAAGPFMPALLKMLDIELPLHALFQQKIAMQDPAGAIPRHAPFTIFLDQQLLDWSTEEQAFWQSDPETHWMLGQFPSGLHIRPEGSGDSSWIKLGWAFNREVTTPLWDPPTNEAFPEIMLRGAARLAPGLRTYFEKIPNPLVHYGGYYLKTPENLPVVGPLAVNGAYTVGALAGYGTMAGCAVGELCAAWVADSPLPAYGEAFSPARYQDQTYVATLDTLNTEGEL